MDLSEFDLIGRIAAEAPGAERFETGIGDDAAVIRTRGRIVTSVDTAVAGVHFSPERPAAESARKALAGAVSDLAAMGAETSEAEALIALGVPPETGTGYLEDLAAGTVAAAREFGLALAGGDVVSSPVLFLSVTVTAHVTDETPLAGRSGARPGDVVAVTGPVGGAAAGLALLQGLEVSGLSELTRQLLIDCQVRPDPELTAGPVLAAAGATTMIDVSDGLVADLGHVAAHSGVTIRLEAGSVPLVPGVSEVAAALDRDPLPFALSGGEDYILALTMPPDRFEQADSALIAATGFELLAIGAVAETAPTEDPVIVESERGEVIPIPGGHDHLRRQARHSR